MKKMKTKSIIIFILMFPFLCKSQILLEHSYPSPSKNTNLRVVNLSISGYKYVLTDYVNHTVKLFNLNHSLWKVISLSIPNNYTFFSGPNDISEALFNTDDLVELSYSYYQVASPNINFETKIINENGNVLLTIPHCPYASAVYTGSNGWKLIAPIDSVNSQSNSSQDVYDLVGTLPVEVDHVLNNSFSLSNPYPNPSKSKTKINYQLPYGTNTGIIIFYDIRGHEVKRFTVDNSFSSIELTTDDLNAGTYLYSLITPNDFSNVKKLIIIK